MSVKQQLRSYLNLSYRQRVLGQKVRPEQALKDDEEFIVAMKDELGRIKNLGLGANLATRDFATYQSQKAIEHGLVTLEQRKANAARKER